MDNFSEHLYPLEEKPVVLFHFVLFLITTHGFQDPGSQTRDWTLALGVNMLSPNHWTAREFPEKPVF